MHMRIALSQMIMGCWLAISEGESSHELQNMALQYEYFASVLDEGVCKRKEKEMGNRDLKARWISTVK